MWQESNDNDEDEDEDTTKTSPSDASTRASEGVGEGSESEGAAPVETPRQGFKGAIEARNLYVSRLSGEGADDDEGESKREMENEDRRQMEVEREKKKKDKESEREELRRRRERGKEGQRLLAEAVKYYMMAADESSERAPSKRGLFSMGWLHQVCGCGCGYSSLFLFSVLIFLFLVCLVMYGFFHSLSSSLAFASLDRPSETCFLTRLHCTTVMLVLLNSVTTAGGNRIFNRT